MNKTTRRDFIRTTSAAAAGAGLTNLNILRPERVMGANDRVRLAIVGAGDRMMGSLVPSFFKLADELNFELVAVCDIWKHHREAGIAKIAGASEFKAKAQTIAAARNTDELYAMKDIDAVMIGTADFQHAYHAIEAVKAGKDVYAEKPFANIMSDANEALKVIGGSKQVFQVGTQRRSTKKYIRAKEYPRFRQVRRHRDGRDDMERQPAGPVAASPKGRDDEGAGHRLEAISSSTAIPSCRSIHAIIWSSAFSGPSLQAFPISGWFTRSTPCTGSPTSRIRAASWPTAASTCGKTDGRTGTR